MSRAMLVLLLVPFAFPLNARADDAMVAKGQQVFAAKRCAMCHSVAGKGNPRGSLDGVGSKWTAEELRQWIVNWRDMAAKHNATRKPPMSDYSKLPKAEVDGLVAYLQTLK